jgi:hypothetical protein
VVCTARRKTLPLSTADFLVRLRTSQVRTSCEMGIFFSRKPRPERAAPAASGCTEDNLLIGAFYAKSAITWDECIRLRNPQNDADHLSRKRALEWMRIFDKAIESCSKPENTLYFDHKAFPGYEDNAFLGHGALVQHVQSAKMCLLHAAATVQYYAMCHGMCKSETSEMAVCHFGGGDVTAAAGLVSDHAGSSSACSISYSPPAQHADTTGATWGPGDVAADAAAGLGQDHMASCFTTVKPARGMIDGARYLRVGLNYSNMLFRAYVFEEGNAETGINILRDFLLPGTELLQGHPTEFHSMLIEYGPAFVNNFAVYKEFLDVRIKRHDVRGAAKCGTHAMVLLGVRIDSTGKLWFLLQNWWEGKQFVEVSEDYWSAVTARAFFVKTTQTHTRQDMDTHNVEETSCSVLL